MTSKTLSDIWRHYEASRDSFKIVKRAVSSEDQSLLNKTNFIDCPENEVDELIDEIQKYSDDSYVVLLWADFERQIFDFLHFKGEKLKEATPEIFAKNLNEKFKKESERWKPDEILDLFKPHLDPDFIGRIKQIKNYRDCVVHHKMPSDNIGPKMAHEILSEFINEMGKL
jgi:hypothetical protein